MKKTIALILCLILCFGSTQAILAGGDDGPVLQVEIEGPGTVAFGDYTLATETDLISAFPGDVLILNPDPGYAVESIYLRYSEDDPEPMDLMRDLSLSSDGSGLQFKLEWYFSLDTYALEITFAPENASRLLSKDYAVVDGSEADIQARLKREFAFLGFLIDEERIDITPATPTDLAYDTFEFTVDGLATEPSTGYLVDAEECVLFRFTPTGEDSQILLATAADGAKHLFGVPAMSSGTIDLFGPENVRLEGIISQDVRDALVPVDNNAFEVTEAFYRAQLHIGSGGALNWFGLDLIQANALCILVEAGSDQGEQKTKHWALNRYAQVTESNYTSEVFFGNDTVILSLPEAGIGGANTLSLSEGDFTGYSIEKVGATFEITFHSNYYNEIDLDLTLNNNLARQLTVRRVGVVIEDYAWERGSEGVFHGTEYASKIEFNDDASDHYQVFGTFYLPDGEALAPYGLFVSYLWPDGSRTHQLIDEPIQNPFHTEANFSPEEDYEDYYTNGVYHYEDSASACDYLLYAGPDMNTAPLEYSVTVLKDEPSGDYFGGVSFGSGAGVTWARPVRGEK